MILRGMSGACLGRHLGPHLGPHLGHVWQGCTPRGKTGCPTPQKVGLALRRPTKLTKSAGLSGAKLTADSIDTPFHYARK